MKKPWQSKTIWVNLLMAVAGVVGVWWPPITDWLTTENTMMIFGFVNMILRATTKDKIEFI